MYEAGNKICFPPAAKGSHVDPKTLIPPGNWKQALASMLQTHTRSWVSVKSHTEVFWCMRVRKTWWRATLAGTFQASNCTKTTVKCWSKHSSRNSVGEGVNCPSLHSGWLHRKDKAAYALSEALPYSSSQFEEQPNFRLGMQLWLRTGKGKSAHGQVE